ncbi:MAG TPA: hypothetical protein VLA62_11225, partial [Solirubrobacterales bacterium]|nr:hypothetical protein [Solirubrobacterales bacterium]
LEGGYRSRAELARAYAEVLAEEVADLSDAGAELVQVDEPFLLRRPEDVAVVRETFGLLARRRGAARLACYTYFGDAVPLYDALQTLPVDVLGLDFTYSPGLARRVAESGSDKTLALGLFDGRNTKLETAETVFPALDRVMSRLRGDGYVNPSCGLEYLPRARARAKLDTMVSLVRSWEGRRRAA